MRRLTRTGLPAPASLAVPAALLLAGLLSGWLAGCEANGAADPSRKSKAEQVTAVRTAPVTHIDMAFPIHTAGMVDMKETVKLSFKIGGIVERIAVDEGQDVKAGQPLAQLDLAEINAQVDKARSAYEKSERDLARARNLYADRVATLEQLQNAETGLDIAASDLKVARFNLRHSAIVAPSKGKILKRFAEAGELVSAGMPVFIFASTEKNWIIRLGVIDRDILRLSPGDRAEVDFDVYPDRVFEAVVSEIAETADAGTGTFEIELSLDDSGDLRIVSGFIAKVLLHPARKRHYALVPLAALVEGDGNAGYVFTVDEASSTAVKLPVTVARIADGYAAITAGLDGVSLVVSTGAPYLDAGFPLAVEGVDPPPSFGSSAAAAGAAAPAAP